MISESSRFFTSLPLPRSCVSLFGGTVLEVLGRALLSSKTESSASAIRGRFGSGSSPSPSWGVEVVVESYDEAGQHLGTGFIVFLRFPISPRDGMVQSVAESYGVVLCARVLAVQGHLMVLTSSDDNFHHHQIFFVKLPDGRLSAGLVPYLQRNYYRHPSDIKKSIAATTGPSIL
jgi:hypothetical protein